MHQNASHNGRGYCFPQDQITKHYNIIELYDPDQEGFTKSKNTGRYLNRLHLSIKSDMIQSKTSICLFVDLEKSFDSVSESRRSIAGNFTAGRPLPLLPSFGCQIRTIQPMDLNQVKMMALNILLMQQGLNLSIATRSN